MLVNAIKSLELVCRISLSFFFTKSADSAWGPLTPDVITLQSDEGRDEDVGQEVEWEVKGKG